MLQCNIPAEANYTTRQDESEYVFSAAPEWIVIMEHLKRTNKQVPYAPVKASGPADADAVHRSFLITQKTIVGIKSTFDSVGRHVGGGHN